MSWLDMSFYGNTVREWLIAVGILILSYAVLYMLLRVLIRRLALAALKTRNDVDDFLTGLFQETKTFFSFAVGLYIAAQFLTLSDQVSHIIYTLLVLASLAQVGFWSMSIVNYLVRTRITIEEREGDVEEKTTLSALGLVIKIVIWSIVSLLILENLTGVRVDTLIASLGIGGIAVALAVQNILGDLFSALTIALDKPFVIDDFINVGEYSGAVEHVGLKSTRLRSLTGEQLVFSNSDLLGSRLRNYKRMQRRRIAFSLGVTYQTPHAKLVRIPDMVREIIEGRPEVTYDRTNLSSLGDSAIQYDIVYFMEKPDFMLYVETHESINLEILRRFEEEGIEFAYPTQTLFVAKDGA
jgi:small-conductance mechanosensitive channel